MIKLHAWRCRHVDDEFGHLPRFIIAGSVSQARQMAEARQLEYLELAHWVREPGRSGPWNNQIIKETCRLKCRERRARRALEVGP